MAKARAWQARALARACQAPACETRAHACTQARSQACAWACAPEQAAQTLMVIGVSPLCQTFILVREGGMAGFRDTKDCFVSGLI